MNYKESKQVFIFKDKEQLVLVLLLLIGGGVCIKNGYLTIKYSEDSIINYHVFICTK